MEYGECECQFTSSIASSSLNRSGSTRISSFSSFLLPESTLAAGGAEAAACELDAVVVVVELVAVFAAVEVTASIKHYLVSKYKDFKV